MQRKRRSPIERFWAKVDQSNTDGCWVWTGAINKGYGMFMLSLEQGTIETHRYSYSLKYGPIPAGLCVLHHCDDRACVRPDHLFLGTHADNVADKVSKGRQQRGSRFSRSKLTEAAVESIRGRFASGGITQKALAKEFGIHPSLISTIVSRKRWKHVA